jgi:hypothetical protein
VPGRLWQRLWPDKGGKMTLTSGEVVYIFM